MIRSSGNVGIGTTSPGRLLQVAGAARFSPTTTPSSPAAGDLFFDSAASNSLKFHNGSGWITVGSGSGDLLNGGNAGAVVVGSNNSTLSLEANNAVAMTVLTNGNVGIGTTNPSTKLEIIEGAGRLTAGSGGTLIQRMQLHLLFAIQTIRLETYLALIGREEMEVEMTLS